MQSLHRNSSNFLKMQKKRNINESTESNVIKLSFVLFVIGIGILFIECRYN